MWENTTSSTKLSRDFCARIGPLQLGIVIAFYAVKIIVGVIEEVYSLELSKTLSRKIDARN